MNLINTKEQFGLITKLFHWGIFLLFCFQFFLVYRREYIPKEAPENLQYILLHKSIGACLLVIGVFFILWRYVGKRPEWPATMTHFEKLLAKLIHLLLVFILLAMPLTGLLMSMYAGYDVSVFNMYTLPMWVGKNEHLANLYHDIHQYLSYGVIAVVAFHAFGALWHHFVYKDKVLKNML